MGQTVQLTIPKACHEDWHTMTADQKGRYCKSCCKTVVDFTNMSDRAILHHIANAGGSRICGRLHADQLHRSMTIQKESRWPWLKYFFQFTLPAFLISMKANGQPVRKNHDSVWVDGQAITILGNSFPAATSKIKGRVTDDQGFGVVGATVRQKGTSVATSTDSIGNFSIPCQGNGDFVLVVSCIGFTERETTVRVQDLGEETLVKLTMKYSIGGEIMVVSKRPKKQKRSALELARSVIIPDSVKLSPNPVGVGNDISVELNVKQPGNFNIEVCDLSGRMISKKTFLAESKCFKTSISTQAMTPGNYVVSVRNHNGKKIGAKKIIVQN